MAEILNDDFPLFWEPNFDFVENLKDFDVLREGGGADGKGGGGSQGKGGGGEVGSGGK